MTKDEKLRMLFDQNNLEKEDIFVLEKGGKKMPIVTRTGVQKIQSNNNISVEYQLVYHSPDMKHVIIKAIGYCGNKKAETFGECTPENNKNPYPVAMAEKRALSRVVLTLSELYQEGVFGEEESEDFKQK